MAISSNPPNAAQKNAQKFFAPAEQSDEVRKNARKKERNAVATKTANLRDLRLAKEAADKEVADRLEAENPKPVVAAKKRVAAPKRTRHFF